MSAGTKASELRELGNEELLGKLREAKEELFNLRFRRRRDSSRTNGRLKAVRKHRAIYTLMREVSWASKRWRTPDEREECD